FFFSSRRRHTRSKRDWSSDVCSSDLSLQYQPHASAVAARLAQLLLRRGKATEAITQAEAALQVDPYSLMAVMTVSRAYRRVGREIGRASCRERVESAVGAGGGRRRSR